MEKRPPLQLGVVAIEKGAFGLLSTKVANFTYLFAAGYEVTELFKNPQLACDQFSHLLLCCQ